MMRIFKMRLKKLYSKSYSHISPRPMSWRNIEIYTIFLYFTTCVYVCIPFFASLKPQKTAMLHLKELLWQITKLCYEYLRKRKKRKYIL